MRLTDLTDLYQGEENPEIKGISSDSRKVREGHLFVALSGVRDDGARYIADAIRHGAVAVLCRHGTVFPPEQDITAVKVFAENPRRELAHIAAKFYGQQPETLAVVTGTNGKTSTVHFTQQLWEAMGFKAASMGTLGVHGGGIHREGTLTTPDTIALHAELADLAAAGITHLAMEGSSHGLHQSRLDGVHATVAGFTNLSRDHLDYHKTMDDYLIAKAHLFSEILNADGVAVLNADIPEFEELNGRCGERGCKVISYGYQGRTIKLHAVTPNPEGQLVSFSVNGTPHEIQLPLVGEFQVMNALCALGMVMGNTSSDGSDVIPHLVNLKGAPGRLQYVAGHPKGAVYVDYAHTPDALENILKALRAHTEGRLICIVGCGGDRDAGKRPVMGKIANDMADMVIITDDNPRTEDPELIRRAMLSEAAGALEIGDRAKAIQHGVSGLEKGDVLVIAGKGHEQGQLIGDKTIPFDDVTQAQDAISKLSN